MCNCINLIIDNQQRWEVLKCMSSMNISVRNKKKNSQIFEYIIHISVSNTISKYMIFVIIFILKCFQCFLRPFLNFMMVGDNITLYVIKNTIKFLIRNINF